MRMKYRTSNYKGLIFVVLSILLCIFDQNHLRFGLCHFWERITGIATIWVVYIAYSQLSKGNDVSKAEFIRRFSNEFFTNKTRDIIMLIDKGVNALKYNEGEPPYYSIDMNKIPQEGISPEKIEDLKKRKYYTAFEIDDLLLGPLCDIGFFLHKGLIDKEEANDHFGYYIRSVFKNDEIKHYIDKYHDDWEWLIWLYKKLPKESMDK